MLQGGSEAMKTLGGREGRRQPSGEVFLCVCLCGQMAPACGDQPEEQVQVT